LDTLLKNDLCSTLQMVLEHGLKPQKDLPLAKQITLWKIIETSIDHGREKKDLKYSFEKFEFSFFLLRTNSSSI